MNPSQRPSDFPAWLQSLARFIFGLFGWQVAGSAPEGVPKYVVVGAFHTSNMDGFVMVIASILLGVKLHWLGKHTLFRWPFAGLMRRLGGIPINRATSKNAVEQVAEEFKRRDAMALVVAPEGTRKKVPHWKTGFYYIALEAGVPIVMGVMDYKRKRAGFGPLMYPTGDIEADFEIFRSFYATVTGRHPERQSEITLPPKEEK
jgi:1-acyl-sn-glycerol-3-phosphate acyltransferase